MHLCGSQDFCDTPPIRMHRTCHTLPPTLTCATSTPRQLWLQCQAMVLGGSRLTPPPPTAPDSAPSVEGGATQ